MAQLRLVRKRMTCWLFQILARKQLLREQQIQALAFFLVHLLRRLTFLITHHSLVVCGRFMHLLLINLVEAHFVSGLKCRK
jgi:ABC-type enterochelin transport system permease subunit